MVADGQASVKDGIHRFAMVLSVMDLGAHELGALVEAHGFFANLGD